MPSNIVVIGSSNVDMIAKVEHLPKPGETVGGAVFSQAFGGKGANQAVAAQRAGGAVSFISCLGNDMLGRSMQQALSGEGMLMDHVWLEDKVPTGTALILVEESGENCIAVAPGANHQLTPARIDEARIAIAGAELILLQMEIPLDTVTYVLELAGSLGKKVLLNPAPAQKIEPHLLKRLHILVMNETETEIMTGMKASTQEEIASAAETLIKNGTEVVVITLGARGAYYATRREQQWIKAYPVKPVDTTAAGDVFCGALAAALYHDKKLADAMKFASAAAALSTTRLGAQPSAPTEQEIRKFLSEQEF